MSPRTSRTEEPARAQAAATATCPTCNGRKMLAVGTDDVACGTCNGSGVVPVPEPESTPEPAREAKEIDPKGAERK